jgi:transposase
MFGIGPATRIYLAAGATDMRKGFEGLYGLVRDRLSCDPLSGHVFLFSNAQRKAEHFTAQSSCQRRYAPMVSGIIPECRSATLRN